MLIAQLSDLHLRAAAPAGACVDTAALLRACVHDLCVRQPSPDLLLLSGDLSDSGSAADYALLRQLVQPLRALGVPVLPLLGNHDRRAALRLACA
ncbi:MAG: metallophosphoesterase, partial [Pseudomonadota bacterium]